MHLLIALWALFAAWRWGDWSKIYHYYPTMLYIIIFDLQYNFMTHSFDFHLWKMDELFFPNHWYTDIISSYILLPVAAFLFLSNYPNEWKKKHLHYAKWITIFGLLESIGLMFESIKYENDWNLYWSLLFNLVTFPILRLHYLRPFLAWPVSIVITLLLVWFFEVPISDGLK